MYGEIVWAPFSVGQQLFDENQKFGYARLMNNSALPHRLDRRVPFRVLVGREASRKIPARFIPCNPLKSLDWDERIQGNPKKSNWR
jgi:hypothetical protein